MGSVFWFTGLSGAGKTTISSLVESNISDGLSQCFPVFRLDGDILRSGLCQDLGFSISDRAENIRRAAELSALLASSFHIVLVALISPMARERRRAREIIESKGGRFFEVFIDASLEVVEERDVKGLYKKARKGEVKNFTGIDSPYDIPTGPELIVTTEKQTSAQSAAKVIKFMKKEGVI